MHAVAAKAAARRVPRVGASRPGGRPGRGAARRAAQSSIAGRASQGYRARRASRRWPRCGQSLAATSSADVTTRRCQRQLEDRAAAARARPPTHFVLRSPSTAFAAPWPSGPPAVDRAPIRFSAAGGRRTAAPRRFARRRRVSLAARMPENRGGMSGTPAAARHRSCAAAAPRPPRAQLRRRTSAPPARHALSADAFRVRARRHRERLRERRRGGSGRRTAPLLRRGRAPTRRERRRWRRWRWWDGGYSGGTIAASAAGRPAAAYAARASTAWTSPRRRGRGRSRPRSAGARPRTHRRGATFLRVRSRLREVRARTAHGN